MRFKLLLITALLFSWFASAQTHTEEMEKLGLGPDDETIAASRIFELTEAENPPLAPGCKPK